MSILEIFKATKLRGKGMRERREGGVREEGGSKHTRCKHRCHLSTN